MQSSDGRFFKRNVSSSRNDRSSSNYGKGRKKQNGANGVCDNKMSFTIKRHNRKDQNEKSRSEVLRENMEVFAWTGSEKTVVLRFVMEHQLKIYHLAEPVAHKRRPMTPDVRLVLKEKVFKWLKEGMIKKVHVWVANTIHVKLANGTWKVQVYYSSLNKVCAKDMYPFSEEGEGLASLMGYPYKCFLRLPKEHNQIRMAEDDEENSSFIRKKKYAISPTCLKN
ncbi:hypothetical protein Tco_0378595 [Tanacetum coccineum]